jgi:hypothetical protein
MSGSKGFEQGNYLISYLMANRSGHAVQGMNCLRSLEHRDRGLESHSRHGCMSTFILCLYR